MTGWKAWLDVPATERPARERSLECLTERGLVVASRELSRDGPWRIEIFGKGPKPALDGPWQWEILPERDWVAENQRSFQPVGVGRFWIHPAHVVGKAPAGLIAIRMDAGMAFGTGTHATTRGCLEMLAPLCPAEALNAVDVGCGSGILTIAMAKFWGQAVWGSDSDPQAIAVARENARLNDVAALCHFVCAAGLDSPEFERVAPFDLIVANILAGPLVDLADCFARLAAPGGRVLLSGILVEQADMIVAAYGRCGFALERQLDLESHGTMWRTLLLSRQ